MFTFNFIKRFYQPLLLATSLLSVAGSHADSNTPERVTLDTFPMAESHFYFKKRLETADIGVMEHNSKMTPIDKQRVVRMNRDTLLSSGVFDLDAGDLAITIPDTNDRYISLQVISEQHYTTSVIYSAGKHSVTKSDVGSRYAYVVMRIVANPQDESDMNKARELQASVVFSQAAKGSWQSPQWDDASRIKLRNQLKQLLAFIGKKPREAFGTPENVDSLSHMVGTAAGWGGLPSKDAIYLPHYPKSNDGDTPYALTIHDAPTDGFWSVSVYSAKGFFVENKYNRYSFNNLTAKPNSDGSFTIHFGGDPAQDNFLPITAGWNYTLRLYRPQKSFFVGAWPIPTAKVIN